jgi:hypothetical protein
MRLVIRILGLDLLDLELDTSAPYEDAEDDCSRDLSGGTLAAYPIEAGPTDRYLGFTNGREVDDEHA